MNRAPMMLPWQAERQLMSRDLFPKKVVDIRCILGGIIENLTPASYIY